MKALTMRLHRNRLRIFLLAFWLLGMIVVTPPMARAATFLVINNDGPGEGFNDPTAVAAVGGNTGTTVGAQRLIAFQHAADIWGGLLASSVTIRVGAQFNPLTCSASSGVLGSAGPTWSVHDFAGAPVAATWYPIALANALHGSDLNAGLDDISAIFSSTIGTPGCLELSGWYYGLDAAPPAGKIDFVSVLLHEMGHGLGFLTFVNLTTGAKLLGFNDTFMRNLEDHGATPSDYPSMSDAQRVAASTDTGNLHWVGANVMAASAGLSAGTVGTHVRMYAPNPAKSGSSVSHWDTALTPNQIMEPSYTVPLHNPALELPLFQDIGWTLVGTGPPVGPVWTEIPGGGLTPSSPAAVMDGSTLHLFVRGADNALYVNTRTGGVWSGWSAVPGGGLTPNQPAAVSSGSRGSLLLYVQGADNHLYVNTRTPGDNIWSGWSAVPGGGLTPSGPAAVLDGGAVRLVVRGMDDRLYTTLATTPPYTQIPGGGLTPSSPAALWEGATLHLFVRGTDNHLYVNTRTPGPGDNIWSGWSEVPGGGLTPNQPAAVRDSGGNLRLYVQGADNHLYVNTRTLGDIWSGWSAVPGGGLTPSGPAAVLDGGAVRLVVRGMDDRLYTLTP